MADSPALPSGPAPLTLRTEIALPDRAPALRPVLESRLCLASGRITTVCPPELLTMAGSEQIWRFQARSLAAVLANLAPVGMTGPGLAAEPEISGTLAAPDPSPLSEPPLAPNRSDVEALPGVVPECEWSSPGPTASDQVPFPVTEAVAEAASRFEAPLVTPAPDSGAAAWPLDDPDPQPVASGPEPVPAPAPPAVDTQAATVVVATAEPQGAPWQMTRPTSAPETPLPWAEASAQAESAANALPAWMTEMPVPNEAADPAPLPWGDIDPPSAADTAFTLPDWLSTPPTSDEASALDLFASLDLQEPVELPELEPNPLADLELPPLSPKRS